jgi:aminoglycoside/choline kinase family phosphotransferase
MPAPERIAPMAGDASTRSYFRAFFSDGGTVLVSFQPNPEDQASFLEVRQFLEDRGLPVPRVFHSDAERRLIIQEDLGDELLEDAVGRAEETDIAGLYQEAVDLLIWMRTAIDGFDSGCRAFDLAFDEEKLMWEMEFFMTHFVRGFSRIEPSAAAEAEIEEFFLTICRLLAAEPRIFTHRDYHSRNLMLKSGRLVMIDFQDARMGPAQYDLASLLRDSYVTIPEPLLDDLLARYTDALGVIGDSSVERFRYIFDLMSLQRNIKALGTFGYQATVRESRRYLSSIPRTGSYVSQTINRLPELASFKAVVEDLVCRPDLIM